MMRFSGAFSKTLETACTTNSRLPRRKYVRVIDIERRFIREKAQRESWVAVRSPRSFVIYTCACVDATVPSDAAYLYRTRASIPVGRIIVQRSDPRANKPRTHSRNRRADLHPAVTILENDTNKRAARYFLRLPLGRSRGPLRECIYLVTLFIRYCLARLTSC